jgi:uncharacterized membrane protein YedE/YeeE
VRAENAVALVAGILFAIGLGISGMLRPDVILDFLDVGGRWNPSLLLVMAAAVPIYFLAFRWTRRRGRSVLRGPLELPAERPVDGRLVVGACLFGVGWGMAGLCPGPSVTVAAVRPAPAFLAFVAAMLAGMFVGEIVRIRLASKPPAR